MRARDNPFAVDRIHTIRYRPQNGTLADLLKRLKELNYRAAVIGPEGSGKTTLLEDLERAFAGQGVKTRMVFVNDASPLPDPACRRLLSERDARRTPAARRRRPRPSILLVRAEASHDHARPRPGHHLPSPRPAPDTHRMHDEPCTAARHRPRAATAGPPHLRRIPGHPLSTPPRQHPSLPPRPLRPLRSRSLTRASSRPIMTPEGRVMTGFISYGK